MKCSACNRPLQPVEAMRIDAKSEGKDIMFYIHRPSIDGRCFRQVVFGSEKIMLVEINQFESVPIGGKTVPYRCPVCVGGDYYGKLMFEGDPSLICPNHGKDKEGNPIVIELVPSRGFVEKEQTGNPNLNDRDAVRAMRGL
jgi:hypothetical protein